MSSFESIRMKALKLLALAMRGEGGEARNAQRMLDALCAKHRLDLDALTAEAKTVRELPIVVKGTDWKPKKDLELALLAKQCLCFVCGTDDVKVKDLFVAPHMAAAKTKRKPSGVYYMQADVTLGEWEDWRSCFDHYAPHFWEMQKDLLKRQRILRAAIKKSVSVFVNEHDLFPPDADSNLAIPTPEQMMAYRMASGSVSGGAWQRPAGRLEQPSFMLT